MRTLLILISLYIFSNGINAQDYFTKWYCGGYAVKNLTALHYIDHHLYGIGYAGLKTKGGIAFYIIDMLGTYYRKTNPLSQVQSVSPATRYLLPSVILR